ncbi:unnamed protein product [Trichogramma brassicae]|uniref:Uncharacterized protein n=1 Tax=Trichogramma brassicae TaxID=86971 RepID=A0A6H5I3U3_9HYME|nr:unnamed protein product [Trichogramma brassicae]
MIFISLSSAAAKRGYESSRNRFIHSMRILPKPAFIIARLYGDFYYVAIIARAAAQDSYLMLMLLIEIDLATSMRCTVTAAYVRVYAERNTGYITKVVLYVSSRSGEP